MGKNILKHYSCKSYLLFTSVVARFFLLITICFISTNAGDLPLLIPDESASDWVVDRFAGNSTAGNLFYQGPAREVGGLGRASVPLVLPNGTAYVMGRGFSGLAEVTPDGELRLLMGGRGLIEGPIEQCASGLPFWSIKDSIVYLSGENCLRKIVKKEDGTIWVEVVAGIPDSAGSFDGTADVATFPDRCMGIAVDSQAVFYWLQEDKLRRIKDGAVSTIPLIFVDEPKSFNFAMGEDRLTRGENDNILYISDFFNFRILKCDLTTGELTRVCGLKKDEDPYLRWGKNADGPALTHASANSGLTGKYDPFHNTLWVGGPDEKRFRWLKNGYVKTVIGVSGLTSWPQDVLNVPASIVGITWNSVTGFDNNGGVYISGNTASHGVWRAYNKKEVK